MLICISGPAGVHGPEGACGPVGRPGPRGPAGEQGIAGATGVDGDTVRVPRNAVWAVVASDTWHVQRCVGEWEPAYVHSAGVVMHTQPCANVLVFLCPPDGHRSVRVVAADDVRGCAIVVSGKWPEGTSLIALEI